MKKPNQERIEKILNNVYKIKLYNSEKSIMDWIDEILEPEYHYLENVERITSVVSDWRLRDNRTDHIGHQLSYWTKEYCILKLNNFI